MESNIKMPIDINAVGLSKFLQIIFTSFFALIFGSAAAQTVFFTDDCSSSTGWTLGQIGSGNVTHWQVNNQCSIDGGALAVNSYNGSWSCEYYWNIDNPNGIVAYKTIDATSKSNLSIKFDWKGVGEYSGSNIYDYGEVGYSTDGGSTFTWLSSGGVFGKYYNQSTVVRDESISLPSALDNQFFQLAFRWINDDNSGADPAFVIDNIRVLENPSIPPSTSLEIIYSDDFTSTGNWILGETSNSYKIGWRINDQCSIAGGALAINAYSPITSVWTCEYWWSENVPASGVVARHTINASQYTNLELKFDWKCEGEYFNGAPVDYGQIGYSTDGGSTFVWITIGGFQNSGKYLSSSSIVTDETVILPTSLDETTFELAFRWVNDGGDGGDPPFVVDNLEVLGELNSSGGPLTISTSSLTNIDYSLGQEGAIDITISGGNLPYTYQWSNNATTEDLEGLDGGIYEVIVTDSSGAVLSKTFTIAGAIDWVNFSNLGLTNETFTSTSVSGSANGQINIPSYEEGLIAYIVNATDYDGISKSISLTPFSSYVASDLSTQYRIDFTNISSGTIDAIFPGETLTTHNVVEGDVISLKRTGLQIKLLINGLAVTSVGGVLATEEMVLGVNVSANGQLTGVTGSYFPNPVGSQGPSACSQNNVEAFDLLEAAMIANPSNHVFTVIGTGFNESHTTTDKFLDLSLISGLKCAEDYTVEVQTTVLTQQSRGEIRVWTSHDFPGEPAVGPIIEVGGVQINSIVLWNSLSAVQDLVNSINNFVSIPNYNAILIRGFDANIPNQEAIIEITVANTGMEFNGLSITNQNITNLYTVNQIPRSTSGGHNGTIRPNRTYCEITMFECRTSVPGVSRKLDNGFYRIENGILRFLFNEEYYVNETATLNYRIYDELNVEKLGIPVVSAISGEKQYEIDLNPLGMITGYYVLEVENVKGEKRFLRFKL